MSPSASPERRLLSERVDMEQDEKRTFKSLSMSRIRVRISSVLRAIISSGMSAQVSSAGWSGVVSIASWGASEDEEGAGSGAFSLLFPVGGFGGCWEAMRGSE